jgi:hypothetical protein
MDCLGVLKVEKDLRMALPFLDLNPRCSHCVPTQAPPSLHWPVTAQDLPASFTPSTYRSRVLAAIVLREGPGKEIPRRSRRGPPLALDRKMAAPAGALTRWGRPFISFAHPPWPPDYTLTYRYTLTRNYEPERQNGHISPGGIFVPLPPPPLSPRLVSRLRPLRLSARHRHSGR